MPPGGLKQLIDAVQAELEFVNKFKWKRNLDNETYDK